MKLVRDVTGQPERYGYSKGKNRKIESKHTSKVMTGYGHLQEYVAVRPVDRTTDSAQNTSDQRNGKRGGNTDNQPGQGHADKPAEDGASQPDYTRVAEPICKERTNDCAHAKSREHQTEGGCALLSLSKDVSRIQSRDNVKAANLSQR